MAQWHVNTRACPHITRAFALCTSRSKRLTCDFVRCTEEARVCALVANIYCVGWRVWYVVGCASERFFASAPTEHSRLSGVARHERGPIASHNIRAAVHRRRWTVSCRRTCADIAFCTPCTHFKRPHKDDRRHTTQHTVRSDCVHRKANDDDRRLSVFQCAYRVYVI